MIVKRKKRKTMTGKYMKRACTNTTVYARKRTGISTPRKPSDGRKDTRGKKGTGNLGRRKVTKRGGRYRGRTRGGKKNRE